MNNIIIFSAVLLALSVHCLLDGSMTRLKLNKTLCATLSD